MSYKGDEQAEKTISLVRDSSSDSDEENQYIVSQEEFEETLGLLFEDNLSLELFGQISEKLLIFAQYNLIKDPEIVMRLFHFYPLWEQTNNNAVSILLTITKQKPEIIESLPELDSFCDILIVSSFVNKHALKWIISVMNQFPCFKEKFNEIGFFHSFLENSFHKSIFNDALFNQNISFLYNELKNIQEGDFVYDSAALIIEKLPEFIKSYKFYKDGKSKEILNNFLSKMVGKRPQSPEEMLEVQMKITELTNSNFTDESICSILAFFLPISIEDRRILSFIPKIVELTVPIIPLLDVKASSYLCYFISWANSMKYFKITKEIVDLMIPKFLQENDDKNITIFASFFSEFILNDGIEAYEYLLSAEIPQRFICLIEESSSKTKRNILLFFNSLLDPSVYDATKDILEDGLFSTLCDISLIALEIPRNGFFNKLVELIQFLITRKVWPDETELTQQLLDSGIPDYLNEKEKLTNDEEQLLSFIDQLQ